MNKFQKLAQLNQDIELLETAGKFKAAEILQKKFVREAQVVKEAQFANMYNNPTLNKDIKVNRYQNYQNYQTPQAPQSSVTTNMYNDPALNKDIKLNRYQEYQTPTVTPIATPTSPQSTNLNTQQQVNQTAIPTPTSQQSTNPMFTLNQFSSEGELYNAALNKIKQEFLTLDGDRDLGEKVYTDTIVQFSTAKTKRQFANQVQNLRTQAFRRTKELYNQER